MRWSFLSLCPNNLPKALKGAANALTILFPPFFCSLVLPAVEPESSITFASGSPSRSMVDALHIAVAAIVKVKAISMAIILRLFIGPTPLHLAEGIHQCENRRAENSDEQS